MGVKALAIGAGPEQRASIAAARRLGCAVLALDGRADAEARDAADAFGRTDLRDPAAVLEAAQAFDPGFIVPAPLARPLIAAGAVNDALGLKGVTLRAARLANDKQAQREAFTAAGVPMAAQEEVSDPAGIAAFASAHGWPVIVKPRFGSGSRGVRLLSGPRDLPARLPALLDGDAWLAETALQGREIGVDGAVAGGETMILGLRLKTLTPPPERQAMGYLSVDPDAQPFSGQVREAAARCMAAMDCQDCLFHADMMVAADGSVSVIELAPRPAGHAIHSVLQPRSFDQSLLEWFIDTVLMDGTRPRPRFIAPAWLGFLDLPPGRVAGAGDFSALVGGPGRIEIDCPLKPGDRLAPVTDGASAMSRGWVLVSTADEAEGRRAAMEAADRIAMERADDTAA